tara:strand:+ start:286 stop:1410 length:1125 start_codon:yes stop_codon:yes gene_type:complete
MTSQSTQPPPDTEILSFRGHYVAFTGKLSSVGRREANALVGRLGGIFQQEVNARTTILVIGDESVDEKSNKVRKAKELNQKSPGSVSIIREEEFCRLAGLRSSESLKRFYHGRRQIQELYPLIRDEHLRYLRKWDLIRPVIQTNSDSYYSFGDVTIVKHVHDELSQDVSFRGAVRAVLSGQNGQLSLDFNAIRSESHPAKVILLDEVSHESSKKISGAQESPGKLAAQFFHEGSDLDEGPDADPKRAAVAYRKALLLEPSLVPALVNLANIHYAQNQLVEAQALYERALNLEVDCFEAFFNLGNIHHDLGRYLQAVEYYREALRLQSTYADAHFYLAVTLEKMGLSTNAKPHWKMYQQLEPDGEWVDLAREFSE